MGEPMLSSVVVPLLYHDSVLCHITDTSNQRFPHNNRAIHPIISLELVVAVVPVGPRSVSMKVVPGKLLARLYWALCYPWTTIRYLGVPHVLWWCPTQDYSQQLEI